MRMAWAGAWGQTDAKGRRILQEALGLTESVAPTPPSHRDGREAINDLLRLNRLAGPSVKARR
jgi:hypothetical protein